jgi:hypothetical protein
MQTHEYIKYLKEFSLITSGEFTKAIHAFGITARTGKLSPSVTQNLQIFDIITQRLQHLLETHEKVMALYVDDIFKESFLHLQYFQFSIIAFDLFEVIEFVDQSLQAFTQQCDPNQSNYIPGKHGKLDALSEKIKQSLSANAGHVRFVKIPALTNRQIAICRQLYTMERERVVLDWYISNSSKGFSDLLKVYQSWLSNYNDPSIELFDNV